MAPITTHPYLHIKELSGRHVKLPVPTEADRSKEEPDVNPEQQEQNVNSLVKDILRHHYKDDPFMQSSKSSFYETYRKYNK